MRWWIAGGLLLSGCNMQPNYCRPQVCLYPTWRIPTAEQNEYCNLAWWTQLGDPLLTDLIERALANNQDLKVAISRVDEYVAQLGVVRSQLFPQISGQAVVDRQRISTTLNPITPGVISTFNQFIGILNASFQLDLWGQLRSETDVAFYQALSQVENRRTVVLTLVGEVARAYIDLKKYQLEYEIAKETLRTRKEGYELAKIRFELGLTSQLQVDQSLSEMQDSEVNMQQFEIYIALQENLLSFLVGEPSHAICGGKKLIDFEMPQCVPAAVPCELLSQRPDIVAAEDELLAANANIGVARALFFPQISLTAALDTETSYWRKLFIGPSSTWLYGANIIQEIFTGGRLTANLWETFAVKCEAVHHYESVVLNAVKEVNDALISHKITLDLVQTEKERVDTLTDYLKLSKLRYTEGLTDYLTVLDAERQLFRAQIDLAETQGSSYTTLVDIYTSLGGGWVCQADKFAQCMNNHPY